MTPNARNITVTVLGDARLLEATLGKAGASVNTFARDAALASKKLAAEQAVAAKQIEARTLAAQATMTKAGNKIHAGFGAVATGLVKGAKYGGIGVAVGLGFAVSAAGDFQQKLDTLWAVADHGGVTLSDVSKKAIQLGADVKLPATSAKDAAGAMFELAKGGLNARQAMAAARGTILLSTAAQIDNAAAGKAVVQALKAFKLPASQAQTVVDDFAGAANQSTADMTGVTEAMAQAGSGAKALNVPIGDTATAIAELANAGIQGGLAGSSLSTALVRLASGAAPIKNELKKLNISAFDTQGNFIGMSKFAGVYTAAMRKLTPQQRLQATATIFGQRGMKAALNVFGAGAKTFDALRDKVTKAGQAQKFADAQTKGFKGAMSGLRSTLETLQITIGLKLLPYATRFVRWLTDVSSSKNTDLVIAKVTSAAQSLGVALRKAYDVGKSLFDFYQAHAGTVQLVTGLIAGLVVGIEIYIVTVKAVTLATEAWAAIQALLDGLLVANPIGLVVVAIAALVAAMVVLYVKNKAVHDALQSTFGWMRTNIPPVIALIANVIRGVWGPIAPFVKQQFANIAGFVRAYLQVIKDIINLFGDLLHGRWSKIWGDLKALAADGVRLVWAYLKAQYGVAFSVMLKLGGMALRGVVSGLKALPGVVWNLIKGAIRGAINGIPSMLGALKSAGSWIANAIVSGVEGLPGALSSAVSNGLSALASLIASFHVDIKTKTMLGVPIPVGMSVGFSGGGAKGSSGALAPGGDTGLGEFLNKVGDAIAKKGQALANAVRNGSISGIDLDGKGGSKGGGFHGSTGSSSTAPGSAGSPGGGGDSGGGGGKGESAADKAAAKAKKIADAIAKIKKALQDVADATAKARDAVVAKLGGAFDKVSGTILKAFDAKTQKGLKDLSDAADKAGKKIADDLTANLKGISDAQAVLTPSEQALADLQAGHDQSGRNTDADTAAKNLAALQAQGGGTPDQINDTQKAIVNAQIALQNVKRAGTAQAIVDAQNALKSQQDVLASLTAQPATPDEIAAAQKAVDDAAYNQRVYDLGVAAAAERKAKDDQAAIDSQAATDKATAAQQAVTDQLAKDQLNYQASRDIAQTALNDKLADLKASLAKHPKAWASTQTKILKQLTDGVGDYAAVGSLIGEAYIANFKAALGITGGDAKDAEKPVSKAGAAAAANTTKNAKKIYAGKHALGGVFDRATLGWFGEDGAEAIVPLTKPARAKEVMQQAGLGGASVVQHITFAPGTPVSTGLAVAGYRARMALG